MEWETGAQSCRTEGVTMDAHAVDGGQLITRSPDKRYNRCVLFSLANRRWERSGGRNARILAIYDASLTCGEGTSEMYRARISL